MTDRGGIWARGFATGLSSLRDRAANLRRRLAALRFNPSRVIGNAMLAAPFLAMFVGGLLYIGFLPTILIFGGTAALYVWISIAVRLT